MNPIATEVLDQYGLRADAFTVERIGTGHINHTYKLNGERSFILQRINSNVFIRPEVIDSNLKLAADFLNKNHPSYNFIAPVRTARGEGMVHDNSGNAWRLYPYIPNTTTINEALTIDQARRAAAGFGKLGRLLRGCNVNAFLPSIERFHDLSLRFGQFEDALKAASSERKTAAAKEIEQATGYYFLVERYVNLIREGKLRPGIFHNDTKINNVLFDNITGEVVGVIDLDTLMPGYFIYDLGDLVRTLVSPVSEEEKDLTKVIFRNEFYTAVVDGYLSEMGEGLSEGEKEEAGFAGPMMTYIMALRFLADFLRGDTYYHTTYPGQNLVRAKNQLKLLSLLPESQLR